MQWRRRAMGRCAMRGACDECATREVYDGEVCNGRGMQCERCAKGEACNGRDDLDLFNVGKKWKEASKVRVSQEGSGTPEFRAQ